MRLFFNAFRRAPAATAIAVALACSACSAATPTPTATPTVPVIPAATRPPAMPSGSPTPRIASTRSVVLTPSPDPQRGKTTQGFFTTPYVVQRGDTLSGIALRFNISVDDLQQLNQLSADAVRIGQTILVRVPVNEHAPSIKLIPDSELVNGPSAVGFDIAAVIDAQRGYLADYSERVGEETLSGAQIIQRVADQTSVHPRLLLAALEYAGGWLSNPSPGGDALLYPLGNRRTNLKGLYVQLSWAAGRLNEGYYGWRLENRFVAQFDDGTYAFLGDGINAGTAALQNWIALLRPRQEWRSALLDDGGADAFLTTYRRLFGNPWRFDQGTPIPEGVRQPNLALPWADEETWFFTGGPHAAWGRGTPWGALDFTTVSVGGCSPLPEWVTAMADGIITRSSRGEVVQSLDPSGDDRIGWSVLYLHIGTGDRIPAGTPVKQGDKIGHPSCEGGISYAAHIHLVRRYNGEWVNATGAIPFVMSGWQAREGGKEYDGMLVRGAESREACECKTATINGVKR